MEKKYVDWKDLKSRVSIETVAYDLGYRLNRKAGVSGKCVEYVLNSAGQHDTILICNHRNNALMSYFRRNNIGGGDVIAFIKENLAAFPTATGKTEWHKVANILRHYANLPVQERNIEYSADLANGGTKQFDKERYLVEPYKIDSVYRITRPRGLSRTTLELFTPFLNLIKDLKLTNFNGFNLGFPYTDPSTGEIMGYEIRGSKGFKSAAVGTSSAASWIADFSLGNPSAVENVYFFESAFDAMAFVQANAATLNLNKSVMVSVGGSFSTRQIRNVYEHYPKAKMIDCFDNDICGRSYGVKLAAIINNVALVSNGEGNDMIFQITGKTVRVNRESNFLSEVCDGLGLSMERLGQFKAPADYKDWNDAIMGKSMTAPQTISKAAVNEKIAEQSSRIKI